VRICVCTYGLGTLVIAKQIHRYTDTQIHEITQTQAQTEKVAAAINQSSANLPRHSGTVSSSALSCVRMSGGGGR